MTGEYRSLGPMEPTAESVFDPDGRAFCECGECWFRLEARPNDPDNARHGAMTITNTGMLRSYIGRLVCVGCDKYWSAS